MVVANVSAAQDQVSIKAATEEATNFYRAGRLADAEAVCRKLLQARPRDPEVLHLLSRITRAAGNPLIAEAFARRAIKEHPDEANYHRSLGKALQAQGKLDQAVTSYEHTLELAPTMLKAYVNLGTALREKGEPARANAYLRRALELAPDDAAAHLELGLTLQDQFEYLAAEQSFVRAVDLAPTNPATHVCLAGNHLNQGRVDEAVTGFREALAMDEGCAETHSSVLFAMHYLESHSREDLFAEAKAWGTRHAASLGAQVPPHLNDPDPDRRLRIGYVSGDFHRHPVGYFLEAALRAHDKENFEIYCYSSHRSADDLTKRLMEAADKSRLLAGIDDQLSADAIRRDNIDILIDLSGHTGWHRLLLFARRPAPVQVSWIGYFDTTGLSGIDYIVLDRHICPPGDERFYTEKVLRLPETYLCYSPQATIEVGPPPALANDYITFGCFNKVAKINDKVMALWAQILQTVPDSQLYLKDVPFTEPLICERWRQRFADFGVAPERLRFLGRTPYDEHQQAYRQIDIALDPFPFNGGTTTVEALWMGVPVITLAGDHFVSRMGVSHLNGVGLPELIATSPDEYVAKAVELARDLPRLSTLRAGLRQRMTDSPLCDGASFTRGLENAYRTVWRAWCQAQQESDSRV